MKLSLTSRKTRPQGEFDSSQGLHSGDLDLHNHTLGEALETFVDYYNRLVRIRCTDAFMVIHGYGSTTGSRQIRTRLRALLARYEDRLLWKPVEGNPGCTLIYPFDPLPPISEMLREEILEFCIHPRTMNKIDGEFRQYRPRDVMDAVRKLVREGKLEVVNKGAYKHYRTKATASPAGRVTGLARCAA